MIDIFGWVGSNLFAFCALPQCIKVIREGHARGLSKVFTAMWLGGEVFMTIYVLGKHGIDLPLLWNYWVNTCFVLIMVKYMIWPRQK